MPAYGGRQPAKNKIDNASVDSLLAARPGHGRELAYRAPARAADWPVMPPARTADSWAYAPFDAPPATYTGEVGLRLWYGNSSTAKNLYDNTGSLLVSRLTYDRL